MLFISFTYPEGKKSPQLLATPKKNMCSNSSQLVPSPGTGVSSGVSGVVVFSGMPPEQLVDVLSIFGRAGWGCGFKF